VMRGREWSQPCPPPTCPDSRVELTLNARGEGVTRKNVVSLVFGLRSVERVYYPKKLQ
jgi:hypothetical protein